MVDQEKPIKILIFSWRGPGHPHAGGAEIVTHEHAKGWIKAGHEVTLFTSGFNNAKFEETVDGIRVYRRGGQAFGVKIQAFIWYLFNNHRKFDLVFDHIHGLPFFTPFYIRIKKIIFVHEIAKEVWRLNPWPKPFNIIPAVFGTALEPLIIKILYRNSLFLTVSDSTKKDLMVWGIPKKNIKVIHNGVTILNPSKVVKKENKKTALFLGALSKDKGIEYALEVFKEINMKDPGWQFWIVGKGSKDYLKALQKKAKDLGIAKKIKFWGFVSEQKKFELLSKAHVMINPSVREGWGLVVIEAAAMGTPTIAFNVSGLRDSIINNKTGILCHFPDTKEMAQKASRLLNNKDRYEKMRKACIFWSKNFSWGKSTSESLHLIEEFVKINK